MQAQGFEESDFDYVIGDPRQGTLLRGYATSQGFVYKIEQACPWLRTPKVYVVFYFDRKGSDGKLISYQVSDTSIPIPPP
ncbi:MAG: hypothetical protein JWN14_3600 [Chthonomonadales bacterium]|nr:hypothetical protein [Chthonomonadales bacterium]